MILPYEKIFSRSRGRINDKSELVLQSDDLVEIYTERLHNVLGNPRIRRLFSSIECDDELQEMNFELNSPVDDSSDIDFVCNILTIGISIEWLQPKVDSVNFTLMSLGGKEEKMLNNPHKLLQARLESEKIELAKIIRDHGCLNNSYLRGGT